MLGWEFPPVINGGLGVACHGLAKALCSIVDLEILLPTAVLPNGNVEPFGLRGADQIRLESSPASESDVQFRYQSFSKVLEIPLSLDPYSNPPEPMVSWRPDQNLVESEALQAVAPPTDEGTAGTNTNLYGDDMGARVVEFAKRSVAMVAGEEFDLIHVHDWMTYLAGIELKRVTGKPLVAHVHASQYDRAGSTARGWIYDLEKMGMETADRVIPVSRYTGRILEQHYGIAPRKIRPIHNGAERVEEFHTLKKFPEKLVLFLGRLTAQKGPEYFLEIASQVLEQDRKVRFVMAGSGEKLKALVETGAFKGLGGKFHFTGFLNRERVRQLLSMTDVYCMPSVSEPFGLSALEAAQFGIPAVVSKQSGVAEVLKGALTADYWNTNLMADHIVNLLRDDELHARISSSLANDLQAASWEGAAAKVMEVYQELLS